MEDAQLVIKIFRGLLLISSILFASLPQDIMYLSKNIHIVIKIITNIIVNGLTIIITMSIPLSRKRASKNI